MAKLLGQSQPKGDIYLPLQPKPGNKFVTEHDIDPRLLLSKPGSPLYESEVNSIFERDMRGGASSNSILKNR